MDTINFISGSIEIREKAIIIYHNQEKQILQLLQTDQYPEYIEYSCLDIEKDEVFSVSIYTNGKIIVQNRSSNVITIEEIRKYDKPVELAVDINIDHSKTINTIVDKVKPVGVLLKKLITIGLSIAGILLVLYIASEITYNNQQKAEEEKKKIALERATKFEPGNYLGSFIISRVIKNGKVLVYDKTEEIFGRKAVIYVDNTFGKSIIRGRLDLSTINLIEYLDYNIDATFSSAETLKYRVKSIDQSGNYNEGTISFTNGGGMRLILTGIDSAILEYMSGNDKVRYELQK